MCKNRSNPDGIDHILVGMGIETLADVPEQDLDKILIAKSHKERCTPFCTKLETTLKDPDEEWTEELIGFHEEGYDEEPLILNQIEDDSKIKEWTFTFGTGQQYGLGAYVIIESNSSENARLRMFEIYGKEWGFQYDSPEAAGVGKYANMHCVGRHNA